MEQKSREELIDGLLDVYNDYLFLHNFFGDKAYEEVCDLVLGHLKNITKNQVA